MIELRRYQIIASGFAGAARAWLYRAAGLLIAALATTTAAAIEAEVLAAPSRPPTVIEHQVSFPAGSIAATYAGETRPRVATDYRIDLPPVARLTVKLLAEDPRASFEIIAPGGASVHRAGSGGVWQGHLARDGTWTVRVTPSTGAEARYYIGFMVE